MSSGFRTSRVDGLRVFEVSSAKGGSCRPLGPGDLRRLGG